MLLLALLAGATTFTPGGHLRPHLCVALSPRHVSPVAAVPPSDDDDDDVNAEDGGFEAAAWDAAPDRPSQSSEVNLYFDFHRRRLDLLAGFTTPVADETDEKEGEERRVWAAEMGILSARRMMVEAAGEKARLEGELTNLVKMKNLYDMVGGALFAASFLLLQMMAHSEGWGI